MQDLLKNPPEKTAEIPLDVLKDVKLPKDVPIDALAQAADAAPIPSPEPMPDLADVLSPPEGVLPSDATGLLDALKKVKT